MNQYAKPSAREVKVSVTVTDMNKLNRALDKDNCIFPHLNKLYKNGYENVFVYDDELKGWLDQNLIPYRVNWESI